MQTLTLHHAKQFESLYRLNCQIENYKLEKKNTGEKSFDFGLGKNFLDMTSKT